PVAAPQHKASFFFLRLQCLSPESRPDGTASALLRETLVVVSDGRLAARRALGDLMPRKPA
ncbi:MAG TPA: hypothetical protein VLJ58_03715, partial [Ramlibacter sp.]|nr:hypothetical protein [Ramlibacter sp.]